MRPASAMWSSADDAGGLADRQTGRVGLGAAPRRRRRSRRAVGVVRGRGARRRSRRLAAAPCAWSGSWASVRRVPPSRPRRVGAASRRPVGIGGRLGSRSRRVGAGSASVVVSARRRGDLRGRALGRGAGSAGAARRPPVRASRPRWPWAPGHRGSDRRRHRASRRGGRPAPPRTCCRSTAAGPDPRRTSRRARPAASRRPSSTRPRAPRTGRRHACRSRHRPRRGSVRPGWHHHGTGACGGAGGWSPPRPVVHRPRARGRANAHRTAASRGVGSPGRPDPRVPRARPRHRAPRVAARDLTETIVPPPACRRRRA